MIDGPPNETVFPHKVDWSGEGRKGECSLSCNLSEEAKGHYADSLIFIAFLSSEIRERKKERNKLIPN